MARPPFPPIIHDNNPDPANPQGRGDRHALRKAPISGDVVRANRSRMHDEDDDGPSQEDIERFGDVTRTCPECKKDVFDESALCYHCGHALVGTTAGSPTKNKIWVFITVLILIAIFVFAALRGVI